MTKYIFSYSSLKREIQLVFGIISYFVILNVLLIIWRQGTYSIFIIEQIAVLAALSLVCATTLPSRFISLRFIKENARFMLWISTLLFTIFGLVVPGAIDRSRSIFVLQWVDEAAGKFDSDQLLKEISFQVKIDDKEAILQRLQEQTARGVFTSNARGNYEITKFGRVTLLLVNVLASWYNLEGFTRNNISLRGAEIDSP